MVLIPLGFGRKIPRVPYLTIAIVVGVLVVSVPYFKRVDHVETLRAQALKQNNYDQKLIAFSKADCADSSLKTEECEVAVELVRTYTVHAKDFSRESRKVMQKLKSDVGSPLAVVRSAEAVSRYFATLIEDPSQFSATQKARAEFPDLEEAYAPAREEILNYEKAETFLTPVNKRISALFLAQWLHAGWGHLLGNLIAFLIFALVLEARVGSFAFALIYIAGGTAGLGVQSFFMHDPTSFLVGASANISAVIGAFFVYFFHRPMRVLFTMIVYNKILDCPTWLVVLVLFVSHDIAGALSGGGNVAHLAHLTGFAVGAVLALLFKQADALDATYLYPREYDWHVEMRKATPLAAKLAIADRILAYNVDNYSVREDCIESILFSEDPSQGRAHLEKNLSATLEIALRRGQMDRMEAALNAVPLDFSLVHALKLNQKSFLTLGAHLLKSGHWFTALRLYDAFRFHFPKASTSKSLESTVKNLLEHLHSNQADLSILQEYLAFEKDSTFAALLKDFAPREQTA